MLQFIRVVIDSLVVILPSAVTIVALVQSAKTARRAQDMQLRLIELESQSKINETRIEAQRNDKRRAIRDFHEQYCVFWNADNRIQHLSSLQVSYLCLSVLVSAETACALERLVDVVFQRAMLEDAAQMQADASNGAITKNDILASNKQYSGIPEQHEQAAKDTIAMLRKELLER